MGELQILQLVAGQGAAGVLAFLIVRWYREDMKERVNREQQRTADERADKLLIVSALQENTRAIAELRGVIQDAIRDRLVRS